MFSASVSCRVQAVIATSSGRDAVQGAAARPAGSLRSAWTGCISGDGDPPLRDSPNVSHPSPDELRGHRLPDDPGDADHQGPAPTRCCLHGTTSFT